LLRLISFFFLSFFSFLFLYIYIFSLLILFLIFSPLFFFHPFPTVLDPIASLLATSGAFHSIFRVLLHLSLTVLVHYRSPSKYFSFRWGLPPWFGMRSQATLLWEEKKKKPGQHWFFSVFPQRKYKKKAAFCIIEEQ